MDTTKAPGIRIAQIFLESVEFSHRADYVAPPVGSAISPEVTVSVELGESADHKAGVVRVIAQPSADPKGPYQFRIIWAAVVEQDTAAPNLAVGEYIRLSGPALLLPFVRESLASLTSRGRFGAIWINPINLTLLQPAGHQDRVVADHRTRGAKLTPPRKKKQNRARGNR